MSETDPAVIDRLARIETKLDDLRTQRKAEEDRDEARFTRIEHRLDRVERFMWLTAGIALASGVPNLVNLVS